jgi:Cu/Ag efflux protein CusF
MKLLIIDLAVWAGPLAGCAAKKPTPPPEPAPVVLAATPPRPVLSGKLDEQTVVATATVRKVDQKTRHVTLKRPQGTTFTIVAGPEVHNLRQVRRGDEVRIEYRRSIACAVVGDVVDITYTEALARSRRQVGAGASSPSRPSRRSGDLIPAVRARRADMIMARTAIRPGAGQHGG